MQVGGIELQLWKYLCPIYITDTQLLLQQGSRLSSFGSVVWQFIRSPITKHRRALSQNRGKLGSQLDSGQDCKSSLSSAAHEVCSWKQPLPKGILQFLMYFPIREKFWLKTKSSFFHLHLHPGYFKFQWIQISFLKYRWGWMNSCK